MAAAASTIETFILPKWLPCYVAHVWHVWHETADRCIARTAAAAVAVTYDPCSDRFTCSTVHIVTANMLHLVTANHVTPYYLSSG